MDVKFDVDGATFKLFDKFTVTVPIKDWQFMCRNRWGKEPSQEMVDAEFGLCGARNAKTNDEAKRIVFDTIEAYKELKESNTPEQCLNFAKKQRTSCGPSYKWTDSYI